MQCLVSAILPWPDTDPGDDAGWMRFAGMALLKGLLVGSGVTLMILWFMIPKSS